MELVIVYGTRPEAIKLGPVVAALRELGIKPHIIATGQHWDLLRGTPAETDLADSQSLGLAASGDPQRWVTHASGALAIALLEQSISVVVVQGDTASALAGARAAHVSRLPVAHIEAGIRSGCLEEPWPEEGFRREITQLATWHYAPTHHCMENLFAESVPERQIRLTGNPVVSALERYADAYPLPPEPYLILTMHRREWLASVDLQSFLDSCAGDFPIYWPVHPAVRAKWPDHAQTPRNLCLSGPWGYAQTIQLLRSAHGLITDSGGLVEEATTLGIPTAILRTHNDRPEAVSAGVARQFSPSDLPAAMAWLTGNSHPRQPQDIFGTPAAAQNIAKHLASLL